MCGMAVPSKMSKSEQDYKAEEDFRTMQRAEEVRGDTARHARALAHGRKTITAMSRVIGKGKTGRAPRRTARRT